MKNKIFRLLLFLILLISLLFTSSGCSNVKNSELNAKLLEQDEIIKKLETDIQELKNDNSDVTNEEYVEPEEIEEPVDTNNIIYATPEDVLTAIIPEIAMTYNKDHGAAIFESRGDYMIKDGEIYHVIIATYDVSYLNYLKDGSVEIYQGDTSLLDSNYKVGLFETTGNGQIYKITKPFDYGKIEKVDMVARDEYVLHNPNNLFPEKYSINNMFNSESINRLVGHWRCSGISEWAYTNDDGEIINSNIPTEKLDYYFSNDKIIVVDHGIVTENYYEITYEDDTNIKIECDYYGDEIVCFNFSEDSKSMIEFYDTSNLRLGRIDITQTEFEYVDDKQEPTTYE